MNAQQANIAYQTYIEALKLRYETHSSKDTDDAIKYLEKTEKGIKAGLLKFPNEVITKIIESQNGSVKGADNFVAVKVNVKILHILYAIGSGVMSHIDGYTQTFIKNLLTFQNLNNHEARRTMCRNLTTNDMLADNSKPVKVYHNSNENTAGTQTSSTREALRHLQILQATKRAKGDSMTLCETKQAQVFADLCATR